MIGFVLPITIVTLMAMVIRNQSMARRRQPGSTYAHWNRGRGTERPRDGILTSSGHDRTQSWSCSRRTPVRAARCAPSRSTASVSRPAPNGFLTNKPDCLQLVQDSGRVRGPAAEFGPRAQAIHLQRAIAADAGVAAAVRQVETADVAAEAAHVRRGLRAGAARRRRREPARIRQSAARRGFTSVFLDAMSAGIYGSTPDKLSVEAAFPLVVALEREYGGLFRGMIARRKKEAGPGGVLTSTNGGIGTLAAHLPASIEPSGISTSPCSRSSARAAAPASPPPPARPRSIGRDLLNFYARPASCSRSMRSSRAASRPSITRRSRWSASATVRCRIRSMASDCSHDFVGAPADPRRAVGQQHLSRPRAAGLQEHSRAAWRATQPGTRGPGRGGR